MKLSVIYLGVAGLSALAYSALEFSRNVKQTTSLLSRYEEFLETFDRQQGCTRLKFKGGRMVVADDATCYELRSFDSGKTWFAVEPSEEGGFTITGTADQVYPGLLENRKRLDQMFPQVSANR